jgi:hypothetical protein
MTFKKKQQSLFKMSEKRQSVVAKKNSNLAVNKGFQRRASAASPLNCMIIRVMEYVLI